MPPSRRKSRSPSAADRVEAAERRDQRLAEVQMQLVAQVREIRTGDDWRRWLDVASRFHTYSFNNQLLIMSQNPESTRVAGYQTWQSLGRQVRRGERGIAILAPVVRRARDDGEAEAGSTRPTDPDPSGAGEHADQSRTREVAGFRVTHVFDVSQTDGEPLPDQPKPELLAGQAPTGLWDGLAALVEAQGYTLERGDCGTANGWTNFTTRTIRVRSDVDDAQAAKTLGHEVGHMLMHGRDQFDNGTTAGCRGLAEVEAESLAYLVANHAGLDSGAYTFAYVAAWASTVDDRTPEQVVQATGRRVVGAAGKVIEHLDATPVTAEATAATSALADRTAAGAERTATVRLRAESTARVANVAPAPIPGRGGPVTAQRPGMAHDRLLAAHAAAAQFYADQLTPGSGPYQYLARRGAAWAVGDPNWRVGYAPNSWTGLIEHLRSQGFTDREITGSGLAVTTRDNRLVDRFRDRLMFGLRDHRTADNPVVAFIGRAAPGAGPDVPKYLNSPTTPLYDKSTTLYGLGEQRDRVLDGCRAVVVEGPFDALAVAHTARGGAGENDREGPALLAVATCGTALTAEHVAALASDVTTQRGVIVAFDGDAAGRKAAERAYHLLTPAYEHQRAQPGPVLGVEFPAGTDPASMLETSAGQQRLSAMLTDQPRPLVELLVSHRIDAHADRLDSIEGRVAAVRAVAPLIADRPGEQAARLAGSVAQRLDLGVETVTGTVVDHLEAPSRARARLQSRARPDLNTGRPSQADPAARAAVTAATERLTAGRSVTPPSPRRSTERLPPIIAPERA